MRNLGRISLAVSACLFLGVAGLWVLGLQRASATCPDPLCSGACEHVCGWDYNPQSVTANGTDKKHFAGDLTWEWCLTCPTPFGYADWDFASSQNVNINDATADPAFFYLNTCSGSITIHVDGHLTTACTQPSKVAIEGEVGDIGHGGLCSKDKVLTINNAANCP